MKKIRDYFKMVKKIIYFDSAALSLKPDIAVRACSDFYNKYSVSVRTSNSPLGIKNNSLISNLRVKIANLLNTDTNKTAIIFTSGATASLNLFAQLYSSKISSSDEILVSAYNHSSNFVPWIEIAKQKGAKVVVAEDIISKINEKTKVIAISQLTNNFDTQENIDLVYKRAQEVRAIVVNDAAQAIVYERVYARENEVIAFSANKFYGPTGLGILALDNNLLRELDPVNFGGGSVLNIDSQCSWVKKDSIELFEPGTANFSAMYMFDKSLDFFNEKIGYELTSHKLSELSIYAHKILKKIPNIKIYSKPGSHIILFNVDGVDSHDVAHYLGTNNIYVRSGLFCAHYVRNIKNENSYVRVSLGIYNNKNEIRKLAEVLKNGGDFLVI
ncbi:nitrogen fixation protein NifS [Mycoplasmopsis californica HAZ160_1]|uniref:Nitrogen fixation protein NifS n=2 Tax=Mycoplasmopsis californica TaxID=2113 RepID=A0AAT9F7K9_9BACT|nr:aminotransferase class V-fold PLP-dependent enzyme [Mycoplasmopsis californica]BAP00875.1 nitrogen fixation protein NifS [Mycoplasmopsis californica HAZ160_1]BBG40732.1 nitrogen fixation protein NifS [Mycoplasmopsis californica]BBG41326.1 nitrogen fixation protein NifS [Mycoplasmopsis californica]BBG41919.1 nitrogen fixation protein NifS [Mycoplasmopsis californica]BBG42511.1 nitrogen fixation protein NifS [Mycoplasmopsis californica]